MSECRHLFTSSRWNEIALDFVWATFFEQWNSIVCWTSSIVLVVLATPFTLSDFDPSLIFTSLSSLLGATLSCASDVFTDSTCLWYVGIRRRLCQTYSDFFRLSALVSSTSDSVVFYRPSNVTLVRHHRMMEIEIQNIYWQYDSSVLFFSIPSQCQLLVKIPENNWPLLYTRNILGAPSTSQQARTRRVCGRGPDAGSENLKTILTFPPSYLLVSGISVRYIKS